MKQEEPKSFELGGTIPIWVQPGSDLELFVRFKESVIADTTFTLELEEYRWPYAPMHYTFLDPDPITTGFSEEEIHSRRYDVSLTIDSEVIKSWNDRKFDVKLIGERNGRRWIVVSTTLTVSKGD